VFRELAGALAILVGGVMVVAAMIASGWWALVFLGGSAMVCGGLGMAIRRSPERGDDEDVASPLDAP